MKIIDKEVQLFGRELHLRIVPKKYRADLGQVATLLFNGKAREAERVLDQMREDYCPSYCEDDIEMIPFRNDIKDLYTELGI
jgi:hypothetical protein